MLTYGHKRSKFIPSSELFKRDGVIFMIQKETPWQLIQVNIPSMLF